MAMKYIATIWPQEPAGWLAQVPGLWPKIFTRVPTEVTW
jgi:hypothetical protein